MHKPMLLVPRDGPDFFLCITHSLVHHAVTLTPQISNLQFHISLSLMAGERWEGKSSVELTGSTAEQVWPLLEDFCSLHKWFPNIDTCYRVEGVPGQPGLIRYCADTKSSSSFGTDEKTISWVKEKLTKVDPIQRCFSYETLDNNIGFKYYEATFKVLPIDGDGKLGCQIEWSFVADPIEGWRFEDLVSYVDSTLQFMAKKMEEALQST